MEKTKILHCNAHFLCAIPTFDSSNYHENFNISEDIWDTSKTKMGQGEGKGGKGAGILWAIIWFLLLIFLAWPIGFFVAWFYVLLIPFRACSDAIGGLCDSLLNVVRLPYTCAENMVNMKPVCWTFDKMYIQNYNQNYICICIN